MSFKERFKGKIGCISKQGTIEDSEPIGKSHINNNVPAPISKKKPAVPVQRKERVTELPPHPPKPTCNAAITKY